MEPINEPTRAAIEARLMSRAEQDGAFRQELLRNPRLAIERELGIIIPAYLTVHIHPESSTDLHLVLPSAVSAQADGELSDADLELAAADSKFKPTTDRAVAGTRA